MFFFLKKYEHIAFCLVNYNHVERNASIRGSVKGVFSSKVKCCKRLLTHTFTLSSEAFY